MQGGRNRREKSGRTRGWLRWDCSSAATIDGHIADLIRRGALEADRFVPEDKIRAITRCLNEHPGEKFALIQENLGSDYSYSEIRFVHSALERGE